MVAAERAIEYVKSMSAATPGPRGPRGKRLSFSLDEVALLAPIPRPGKILCIGLNYRDHAEEIGLKLPERPVLFSKYSSCVIGPGEPIVIPSITDKVDYEAELAVVIGKRLRVWRRRRL